MKKLIQQIRKFLPLKPNYIILGIETSCDDTACAIVSSKRKILGECVQSQQEEVLRFDSSFVEIVKIKVVVAF